MPANIASTIDVASPHAVLETFRRCDHAKKGIIDSDVLKLVLRRVAPELTEAAISNALLASCREGVSSGATSPVNAESVAYEDFIEWVFGIKYPPRDVEDDRKLTGENARSVESDRETISNGGVQCKLLSLVSGAPPAIQLVGVQKEDTVDRLRSRVASLVGVPREEARLLLGGDAFTALAEKLILDLPGQLESSASFANAAAGLLLLAEDSAQLGEYPWSAGATFVIVRYAGTGIPACLAEGQSLEHMTLTATLRADDVRQWFINSPEVRQNNQKAIRMEVDWARDTLYYVNAKTKQVGRMDVKTRVASKIADLQQSPTCIALAGDRLIVATAGTESTCFQDAELHVVDVATGATARLLDGLRQPRAVTTTRAERIFYVEDGVDAGTSYICEISDLTTGTCKASRLRTLPFVQSGGLAVLDDEGSSFAVGRTEGSSSATASGSVFVIPSDGEPWQAISGLAANTALGVDKGGCLYCAGSAPMSEHPGLEVFPNFVNMAQCRLPTVLRACADEHVQLGSPKRRQRGNNNGWQAIKSIAVNEAGYAICYSTVRDALRIGCVRSE